MLKTKLASAPLLFALAAAAMVSGCRTAERSMLAISRLKSPVTVSTPTVNKAFTSNELVSAQINPKTLTALPQGEQLAKSNAPARDNARYDSYADLRDKDTVVAVCLSGGGARAARMAAHALAQLETRYNSRFQTNAVPFADTIHAWSSISGGSVYCSFIAAQKTGNRSFSTNAFQKLMIETQVLRGTKQLGGMASFFYLWPGNLGYGPLMQLTTDWDTLDLFAHNLAMFHRGTPPLLPFSRMAALGELPNQPRFFFNATCRETARPFIFTQSVIHRDLSGDPLKRLDDDPIIRWIEDRDSTNQAEAFSYASTLEDLGSPPNRFPLAYAAMASAAFPGVFDPLWLHCYRLGSTNSSILPLNPNKLWWLREEVSLVDGGLYDNSGMSTALGLFDYLRANSTNRPLRLVLVAIDADNSLYGYSGAQPSSGVPFRYDLPFRGAVAAVGTIRKLHDSQQSIVSAAIHHHIKDLAGQGLIEYYPIRLRDAPKSALTKQDESLVKRVQRRAVKQTWSQFDNLGIFGLVEDIPTDFVIAREEDDNLKEIVRILLSQKAQDATLEDRILNAVVKASSGSKDSDSTH